MKIRLSPKTLKKIVTGSVAGIFLFTSVSEPFAQTSFWSERQAARSQVLPTGVEGDARKLLSTVAWPKETLNPVLGAYRLPSTLGTTVETHIAGPDAPTLLHIQDAHGLYPAQYNASKILEGLFRAGWSVGSLPVYQEGGAGPANIDWLSAFPFADIKERVAQVHLRQGDLTGEEYRALVASSGTYRLLGVETESLYKKNLAARHETAPARAAAETHIAAVQKRLNALKAQVFSPSLQALDRTLQDYAKQEISFVDYVQALKATSPQSFHAGDYPQLDALLRLTALEASLNSRALAEEREILVRRMADRLSTEAVKDLVAKATLVREGRLTPQDFYQTLLNTADALKRQGQDLPTRELRNYVGYLRLSSTLRHEELLVEADQLRARLLEKFSKADHVWRLVKLDQRVALERLLWKQEMTPDQYAAFKQDGPLDWAEVEKYVAAQEAQLGLSVPSAAQALAWTRSLPQVRAYYELALERDISLVKNALADLERTGAKRGVLIAGGFHTPGLTRLLRQSGAAYAVVQPRFDISEGSRRAEDLAISQAPDAFADSVREQLLAVWPAPGQPVPPLRNNLLGRMALTMFALAIKAMVQPGNQDAATIERRLDAFSKQMRAIGIKNEIHRAVVATGPGGTPEILLYGQFNGELFIVAQGLGAKESIAFVSESHASGPVQSLNDKLGTLRTSPGLAGSMGEGLRSFWKALQSLRSGVPSAREAATLRENALAGIRRLAEAVEKPIAPAQEGARLMEQAEQAVPAATRNLKARLSHWADTMTERAGVGVSAFVGSLTIAKARLASRWPHWSSRYLVPITLSAPYAAMSDLWESLTSPRPKSSLSGRSTWKRFILPALLGLAIFLPGPMIQSAEAAQLIDNGAYVQVEKGDVVWSIAKQDLKDAGVLKISNSKIAERVAQYENANPNTDLNEIFPGDELVRPPLEGGTGAGGSPASGDASLAIPSPTTTPDLSSSISFNQPWTAPSYGQPGPAANSVIPSVGSPDLKPAQTPDDPAGPLPIPPSGDLRSEPDPDESTPVQPRPGPPSERFVDAMGQMFAAYISPLPAALYQWWSEVSLINWATVGFGMVGAFGAAGVWRRNPPPQDRERWAEGVADRMVAELRKGPRTFPKTWYAPFRRWKRHQLNPDDMDRVEAEPSHFKRWVMLNAMLLQRGEMNRYNIHGAHGQYISFIGLSSIKKVVARVEKADETLARLEKANKDLDRQIHKLVYDRKTASDFDKRQQLAKLNRERDRNEIKAVERRIEIQKDYLDPLQKALQGRRAGVVETDDGPMRDQREVMWRNVEKQFTSHQTRLIPMGFRLELRARFFLTFAAMGRLAFTGLFLSQVFFFPSALLTSLTWVVLGPLLYNISRSFVDPLLIMTFMMFGPPPRGHSRRDFLEVVRDHAQRTGQPYAFSVEVPKMSGNPLDGFLKTDIAEAFLKPTDPEKKGIATKFDLTPESPSADLTVPRVLSEEAQSEFKLFIQNRLWDGFRLDVSVEFTLVLQDGVPIGTQARIRPSPGPAGQRFESEVNDIVGRARGPRQWLAEGGIRLHDKGSLEIETLEEYVSPLGPGMYPALTEGPTAIEEKTWSALAGMIEKEYNLPISLFADKLPQVTVRFDKEGGQVVRRVTYQFNVPWENRLEVAQNLNTTTRFLDTIHLEADVWAAYRRVDIENLRQTLRDTSGSEFTLNFAMPSNTGNPQLIQYELENLQKLQAEMDAEFPGRVSFVYFNQAMEWAAGTEPQWKKLLAEADPLKALGDQFTLFGKDGSRDYFNVQGPRVVRIRTTREGRKVETLTREAALEQLKAADVDGVERVVRWGRGGWGKKLGNVAGLEWLKIGYTRPPSYTNIDAHEHFTNPDAPIFPNAAHLAGDILGYFRNEVLVRRADGSTLLFKAAAGAAEVVVTDSAGARTLSRAEANRELARAIADFSTDRLTDAKGQPLEPDNLSVVMDDKNSIMPGAVEVAIGVAEHPANAGVVGFNPAIEVDAPRNTRGGQAGVYFSSILLDYLDKSRLIHNQYDARFKADLFGNMSAMYGKVFKRAAYGDSFTQERVTVARALSHDWQESQFSPTEAVYGDVAHTFHLVSRERDTVNRQTSHVYRMRLGSRFELIRLVLAPTAGALGGIRADVQRVDAEGGWKTWRSFDAGAEESAKTLVTRLAAYLTNAIGVRERDLLTLAGVVDRDFRWLRGDLQMQATAKAYEKDALPYAHRYHLGGIDFRLNGDPSFLIVLAGLIPLWIFMDQAILTNQTLAYVLFGITMLGVAFRGHFLYPAYYDAMSRVQVVNAPDWLGKVMFGGLLLVFGVKNFLLSILTVSATTLMSLPIALKRTKYLQTVAKVIEFVKNVPSVWVTSSATVVREMLGVKIGETWKSEISMMNLVLFGGLSLVAFTGLIFTGNIYFGALWPLGISILVASMLTGWLVAHFAGQAYRRADRWAMAKRWLQVYGLSSFVTAIVFFAPVSSLLTDLTIQNLRTPPAAEFVLKELADPVTKPRPYTGVDISGGLALQVQRTEPIAQEAAPKIMQAYTNVGAGVKAEVFAGVEPLRLTGRPSTAIPLPSDVRTVPLTTTQFTPPNPVGMLKKPKLDAEQEKRLVYLLSQLDRMNEDKVKYQNLGIYGGSLALIAASPGAAVGLKVVDYVTYFNMFSKGYPWLKEPMVAKYWAQTALLMDLNARGKEGSTKETQARSVQDIAELLLWDKIKEVWGVDYEQFVLPGQTLKHPKTDEVLISEEDYRALAGKMSGSMDKYELLSTSVINLHYGLGYPLEKITPDLVWRFARLAHELEKSWQAVVPSVDIRPVELFPKPVAKTLRIFGNITFVLPIHIPIISDLHIELIPMVTAFYQEPGGLHEFLTQMLEHNENGLGTSQETIKTFLQRIGADYIQAFSDSVTYPAEPGLYELVKLRMTEDFKKLNKVPTEKDLRLAYLQTEYNLGRIALFNQSRAEPKDMNQIRQAGLRVAAELGEAQRLAQSLSPDLYDALMKREPGVLEVEGLMLYLLQNRPEDRTEYIRILREVLTASEQIRADMSRSGWTLPEAYRDHVLTLLPEELVADMSPAAIEYNVIRDLAMLKLTLQKNTVAKADGTPYTNQEIVKELLAVRTRVEGLRVPEKPGIMATLLLHSLKMKSMHPEVSDARYWDENVLPTLRYWADWSARPELLERLNESPHWETYSDKINAEIEAAMESKIKDPEVRQFNAVQSMAKLADAVYQAFPAIKKAHQEDPRKVGDFLVTLAQRSAAYDELFDSLPDIPSAAVGFREYFVVSGFELNGMNEPFNAEAGFAREAEGFVLRPVNDLWNSGLYESLPDAFVGIVRSRMEETQAQLGLTAKPIEPNDLKFQVLQVFYKMATSAMYSVNYPQALPAYSPAVLNDAVRVGRELIDFSIQIVRLTGGLPRVTEYVLNEPGIIENEAIQIYLLKSRAGANFNISNYMSQTRLIYQKIDGMVRDRPGLVRSAPFDRYRAIKTSLLSELARERMTGRGQDFLALRSLATLIVTAEHNDLRPGRPLASRALSPEGWMAAYTDAWDHFENAPRYGGRKYQHIPYREEGFVDMVTLLKQKWGFAKFWESYYYERLNQVEQFMSQPSFVKYLRTPGGTGEKMLAVVNDDIFRKSGIRFAPDHPIYTFNGVIGLAEMFIDAGKKFPDTTVNYQLLAARYLRYFDLFHTPDPATGKPRFPNLPFLEEGFVESLVTGGYNFESNGGRFEDELRIMKLRDVDLLMGAAFLDPNEKLGNLFVRGHLEGIIREESTVPPGVSGPVIDFFILQKIVGLGQTYGMLTGPSTGPGQPSSIDVKRDVPLLKQAARALVYVHQGVRQKTEDGRDLYPQLRPIFNILGESEKWVGRMHAKRLLQDESFPEVFTHYIDVLERHYGTIKGTYLQPEQVPGGGRYLGELGTYLRVLKENLRKDAAAIEARFVTRTQETRRLGVGAGLEEQRAGELEEEPLSQIVFVRPEIDESQFILDAGYIVTEILRDMEGEIAAAGSPSIKGVTVEQLMTHYLKALTHLKTTHFKNDIMRVQSYRDSEQLGRLNGKINNFAMRFAFIDYLVFSNQANPQLAEFFRSNGLTSVEGFIDRFYENLRVVASTEGLKEALEELRNANEYAAEGVEFSYAMMLTMNHRVTPETLRRVAAHIPDILRDYSEFLVPPDGKLKFRVDSAVVLYEALSREMASARPLGTTGDRVEVKQKRTNNPWMINTMVKAIYGSLFGIYLDEDIPEHKEFLKQWEVKAFGSEMTGVVQELAKAPKVMGQRNPYLDEIAKVDAAIKERTEKYEGAKRDLREALAEDYLIQIRILQQIRAGLDERLGYLVQLAESLDNTYEAGVSEKNRAALEMGLLLALGGLGAGLVVLGWRGGWSRREGLTGMAGLRASLSELNRRRKDTPYLSNTALAVILGLPAAYGLIYGVGLPPQLYRDTEAILTPRPYQFEAPRETRDTVFAGDGFVVRRSEDQRAGSTILEHKIFSGGYLVGRVELTTGYAEFLPGAVRAPNGLSYPSNPGPSLVLMGYGETMPSGQKVYRYGGSLENVTYQMDEKGQLVMSGVLRDYGGAFSSKQYQMTVRVQPGRTTVTVAGTFSAQRDVNLSEINVGSLNTQSYIGKPEGAPSPTDRSLSLEAQGTETKNRVYIYFGNDQVLPANGLTTWPVASVTLSGTTYNNTPTIRLTPGPVFVTSPSGVIRTFDPVATYTLLPRRFDGRDNVAIAPIVSPASLTIGKNGGMSFEYKLDITPVQNPLNGQAAPPVTSPPKTSGAPVKTSKSWSDVSPTMAFGAVLPVMGTLVISAAWLAMRRRTIQMSLALHAVRTAGGVPLVPGAVPAMDVNIRSTVEVPPADAQTKRSGLWTWGVGGFVGLVAALMSGDAAGAVVSAEPLRLATDLLPRFELVGMAGVLLVNRDIVVLAVRDISGWTRRHGVLVGRRMAAGALAVGAQVRAFGRAGVALGSWATQKILTSPVMIAAIAVGVVGGFLGGAGAAVSGAGAAKVGLPVLFAMALAAVPTRAGVGAAMVTAMFNSATRLPLQWGGFFGHEARLPQGRAVILDLERAVVKGGVLEIPTALGTAFAAQIAQLGLEGRKEPIAVELRLPANAPAALAKGDPALLRTQVQKVLAPHGLDLGVLNRIQFGVLVNQEAVTRRLTALKETHRVQVITDQAGVAFWAGLGVTLSVIVAFLKELTVHTEVVLTGALADMAVTEQLGQKGEDGSVRLQALQTPLQALESETQTEGLLRIQA